MQGNENSTVSATEPPAEELVKFPENASPDNFMAWLQDNDIAVRIAAAMALGKTGTADSRIVSVLIEALYDRCREVRRAAEVTLGRLCVERAASRS